MPNFSNKNFTTLSHLYDNRTVPHHRDFVRENKENVRDKTKKDLTSHVNRQQTKEKIQIDSYIPLSSSADQISCRSSGLVQENPVGNTKKTTSNKTNRRSPTKKQPWTYGREASDGKNVQKAKSSISLPPKRPPSSTKITTNLNKPKVKTMNIAVQTDEINDEIYLYNALKKCASPAFKSALKGKYLQMDRESRHKPSANISREFTLPLEDSDGLPAHGEDVINEHVRQEAGDSESAIKYSKPQQRAESVQTNFTQDSQRSNFKYSIRNEFYNNTALNVMTMPTDGVDPCSPTKCPNCPVGYHLLSEAERETIKNKLLAHETLLIKQLNSFPLAIETLRVRQSKTRIEKELSILEQNLRKLTKRKVYAKIHE